MPTGRKSAAKREAVAVALACGRTAKAAAAECDIAERTVGLWMSDDAFRRRVGALRGEMVARAVGKMADSMADAADQLRRLLKAKSESVSLAAARSLLELGSKLREHADFEERLAELERRAGVG
jgi:hypothetical protein